MTAFFLSIIIFLLTFAGIVSEKVERALVAALGAIIMVIFGKLFGFYNFEQVLSSIDFNTILLLVSMMIIITVLEKTGVFQYLAIKVAQKSEGHPWKMTIFLGGLTSLLALLLDNVTTIIIIVPVTLIISKILKINPVPILIAEAMLSNIAGVGTLVGDPPNIIVGSAADFSFNTFLLHSLPITIIAWGISCFYIKYAFFGHFKVKSKNIKSLKKMNADSMISSKESLKKAIIILSAVFVGFLFHSVINIPASMVAFIGAIVLLILVAPHKNPNLILKKVEWQVVLFFCSLFVLVGGLEATGVLSYLSEMMIDLSKGNLLFTALIILWGSAFISSLVDNIPMTIAMVPVILGLEAAGLDGVNILWWALIFGVGFGGIATPLGSTAGVIVTGKARSAKHAISTIEWLKVGVPASLISLMTASLALVIFCEFFK